MTRMMVICLMLWLLSGTAFAQAWDYQESKNADGQIAYGAVTGIRYTTRDGRSGAAIILMECDGNLLRVAILVSDVFKIGRSRVIFRVGETPPIEATMVAEKEKSVIFGTAFSTDDASVFDKLKLQLPKTNMLRISIDSDVRIEFEPGDSQAVTKVAAKCGH